MGSNPINLGIRFLLELGALAALAWFGWTQGRGIYRYLLAIGLPVAAAALWGVFAVPDDPSRAGTPVIPIPGLARLVFELAFFAAATWALVATGATTLAWTYGLVVVAHYAASYDRVWWLIQQ